MVVCYTFRDPVQDKLLEQLLIRRFVLLSPVRPLCFLDGLPEIIPIRCLDCLLVRRQERVGLRGTRFMVMKFRSMVENAEAAGQPVWAAQHDARVTAVGNIIRRFRIDELPQLYNVLIGDMSLVGPRPLLPCDQSLDYAARLSVLPGITGWAQVNGGKLISTSDKLTLDIWYVQNASWVLDVAIVFRTVKMILFGDRINIEAINKARSGLRLKVPLRTTMVPAE